ncbi:hypothetical protein D3C73_1006880 [compost metagenome]
MLFIPGVNPQQAVYRRKIWLKYQRLLPAGDSLIIPTLAVPEAAKQITSKSILLQRLQHHYFVEGVRETHTVGKTALRTLRIRRRIVAK